MDPRGSPAPKDIQLTVQTSRLSPADMLRAGAHHPSLPPQLLNPIQSPWGCATAMCVQDPRSFGGTPVLHGDPCPAHPTPMICAQRVKVSGEHSQPTIRVSPTTDTTEHRHLRGPSLLPRENQRVTRNHGGLSERGEAGHAHQGIPESCCVFHPLWAGGREESGPHAAETGQPKTRDQGQHHFRPLQPRNCCRCLHSVSLPFQKELEAAWGVQVFDRFTVVLHIFRCNARTKEARLQVALAELPLLRYGNTTRCRRDSRISCGCV